MNTKRYKYIMGKLTNINSRLIIVILVTFLVLVVKGQDRRPTISFITQPEIVTDIGGTVEMKCSVQVIFYILFHFEVFHRIKPFYRMLTSFNV